MFAIEDCMKRPIKLYTILYCGLGCCCGTICLGAVLSTLSPCRPGGILVCKLEGASFWEKTPGADYLPHQLTLPEGT